MKNDFCGIPIKDEYIPKHSINSQNIYDENKSIKNKNIKNNTKKKNHKNNKWLWTMLLIFFIVVFIFGIIKLIIWWNDNSATSEAIDDINKDVIVVEKEDSDNTELVSEDSNQNSDYWYYVKFPLIDVDINELKKKNSDTIGFINVNNTNINYPYVQTEDNSFYLDHSYDKSYNEAGWVFMDYRNNSNLDNKNTILYAHSRLDKTMFGSLSKVFNSSWHTNKDNHIIRISTETENTSWQIFSVYKIEEESYYITTSFGNDNKYQEFLDTIKGRSIYDFNTNLTTGDKILTLSTCYSDTVRTVVHAKLIKKAPK